MKVDKQLKLKSHKRMQVEFISNIADVMTHDCLSSVAPSLRRNKKNVQIIIVGGLPGNRSNVLSYNYYFLYKKK